MLTGNSPIMGNATLAYFFRDMCIGLDHLTPLVPEQVRT